MVYNTIGQICYDIIKENILSTHKKIFVILCYIDYITSEHIKYSVKKEIAVIRVNNKEILSFSYPVLNTLELEFLV